MPLRPVLSTIGMSVAVYLAFASPAYAYLDPGTGSILLQGLIGAAVGGWVAARLYWSKLKNLVSPRQGRHAKAEPGDDAIRREDHPGDRR